MRIEREKQKSARTYIEQAETYRKLMLEHVNTVVHYLGEMTQKLDRCGNDVKHHNKFIYRN